MTTPRPDARPEAAAPDKGCLYAPKCASCPYSRSIKELAPAQRSEFAEAWRVVVKYVAPPDRTIQV